MRSWHECDGGAGGELGEAGLRLGEAGLRLGPVDVDLDGGAGGPGIRFVPQASGARALASRRLLATPTTLALLGDRAAAVPALPCPVHRPFSLGEVELELLPAGTMGGSAQLFLEHRGVRVLCSGEVSLRPARAALPLRFRRCDLLLLDCALGDPRQRFPARPLREAALREACEEAARRGEAPLLLVQPWAPALELLALLQDRGVPHRCHPSLRAQARAWSEAEPARPLPQALRGRLPEGHALVWPLELRDSWALGTCGQRLRPIALHERAAEEPDALRLAARAALALPWTAQASFAELLALVQAVAPAHVVLRHGRVGAFGAALEDLGVSWSSGVAGLQLDLPL